MHAGGICLQLAIAAQAAHNQVMRIPQRINNSGLLLVALLLSGCASAPVTRNWVDDHTAVAVAAQARPVVLSREDFPAGVNVRDYAELGVFEVNRSGRRQHYLGILLWSTVDRKPEQLAQLQSVFASITLWADDQPLVLRRVADMHDGVQVSTPVFDWPSPVVREAYYELNSAQLAALAAAHTLSLSPAVMLEGEQAYTWWRGSMADLQQFIASLSAR